MKKVTFPRNKAKPEPIIAFSLAKLFNKTMAVDLKQWSD